MSAIHGPSGLPATRWDESPFPRLEPCPFCGNDTPHVAHIGNDHTKKRGIRIKCPSCRIIRTDAALRQGFRWLEDIAVRNWNQRPGDDS